MSRCYQIFDVCNAVEAVKLYQSAFGAEKSSEDTGPNGWVGIEMEIFGFHIFVQSFPEWVENSLEKHGNLCVSFSSEEDLRKAAELLKPGAKNHELRTDWGWTPLVALITDKFGVEWLFAFEA